MAIVTIYHGGLAPQVSTDLQFKEDMSNYPHISMMSKYAEVSGIADQLSTLNLNTILTNSSQFLTTAALSDHMHTNYQERGGYLTTAMGSDAGSLFIPIGKSTDYNTSVLSSVFQTTGTYLTTAALSDHSHSTLPTHTHDYQSTGTYLTTAQPVGDYLTTAAQSDHSHGGFTGTNITGTYNSSELQLSVDAPGGGGVNRSFIEIMQGERLTRPFNMSASQFSNRPIFIPFWLDGSGLAASTVRMLISVVTNTLPPIMTYGAAIYTTNNTSQLGLLCSTTATMNYLSSQSASFSGVRILDITGMTTPIPDGRAVLAIFFSGAATGSINFSVYGGDGMAPFVGFLSGASGTATSDNTLQFLPWWGRYSANSGSFPSTVNRTQIYGGRSADLLDLYAVLKQI